MLTDPFQGLAASPEDASDAIEAEPAAETSVCETLNVRGTEHGTV
jgi:hypothetical protein